MIQRQINSKHLLIEQLRCPISDTLEHTIDYAIVRSNISKGYRLLVWKKDSSCYYSLRRCIFTIEPEYETRNSIRIPRSTVIRRIVSDQWSVYSFGIFETVFQVQLNELTNENYNNYQRTYQRIVSIRNLHNQIYKIFWETPLNKINEQLSYTMISNWFQRMVHRRRKHRMQNELIHLPPIVTTDNLTIYPGGFMFQQARNRFESTESQREHLDTRYHRETRD